MALDPSNNPAMAGRITAPNADYPYGSSQNETSPGAGDGTPYFEGRANDIFGFQQWLLTEAGIVPTGSADTVNASQYGEALQALFASSSAVDLTVMTGSGSFVPAPSTQSFLAIVTAGGGGGGGAHVETTTGRGLGGGGGAGATAIGFTSNVSSSYTVVVGSGGAGSTGALGTQGEEGGMSSLSGLAFNVEAYGGTGGFRGSGAATNEASAAGGEGGPTGAIPVISLPGGNGAKANFIPGSGFFQNGVGGSSFWGQGGRDTGGVGVIPIDSPSPGAGGGGATQANEGTRVGGNGGDGVVFILEFS